MSRFDVVIVGGGQGGAQAAVALRQRKFEGSIAIVGEEPELPYDRPPLSKEYLSGDKPWDRLPFRSAEAWADLGVTLKLGVRIASVDPQDKSVETAAGERIGYEKLIWAAGGRARRLACSGGDAAGVHAVRNRADVEAILQALPSVRKIVVIGGGYIGLEAAAVLHKLGKEVTVVEALDRVLARVTCPPLSRFYEEEHRAHDVDIRLNSIVETIELEGGRAAAVRLEGGDVLPADMVVVGIGVVPEVAPLFAAGAVAGNGVRVDEECRTSLPDVYAVGDCAEHASQWANGAFVRIESVQNANDQAATAAKSIMGEPEPYRALPWFWSNQYDLRLQTAGLTRDYDEYVVRGSMADRSFSIVYLRAGQMVAIDCVNHTRDYAHGRMLVGAHACPDLARLADAAVPLKALV